MKKLLPVVLLSVGLSFGLAISPLPVMAQGVVSSLFPSVAKLTVTAPSGAVGVQLATAGARIDFGTNSNDYLYSSTNSIIETPGYLRAAFGLLGPSVGFTAGALPTCSATEEGKFARQTSTGGTGTGLQTRFCACVSDGAASPTYSWRNVISGTAGNSTTCNP